MITALNAQDEIEREVKRYHKEITYTRPIEGGGVEDEEDKGPGKRKRGGRGGGRG